MIQRLKAWLLDLANADPPPVWREQFYGLKDRLLRKYGRIVIWPLANLQRLLTAGRLKVNSWRWRIKHWWHKRKPAEAGSDDIPF